MNLLFTQQGLISRALVIHVICPHLRDILRPYHEDKQVSVVAKVSGVCAEGQKRTVSCLWQWLYRSVCVKYTEVHAKDIKKPILHHGN